ncbi:MAG: sel1 repeat family protein, partial [Sphingomonadales bacterium]
GHSPATPISHTRSARLARFWYEKSALQGNAQSMMALARIYDGEAGLPPNEALAIYWYKEAYKKRWLGAEQALLARGLLQPDPVSTAFIQRIESQGPDRSSLSAFTFDVAQYCKYGGSRCTALSIEAVKMEREHNAGVASANTARLWNVYSKPGESDAAWRARSQCMSRKTESIQRHTYGQQDWYYSGSCY